MRKIVLTGGPGAGKTVIAQAIAGQFPQRFVLVPEAATQVYDLLKTRWDRLDTDGRKDVQRRIYHLQLEQEARLAKEHPDRIQLLDRGTVDGAAYWPDGSGAYWADLGTSHQTELSRYDRVIWMESCAVLGLYDGEASNTCRFEDAPTAIRSGRELLELWNHHPDRKQVRAFANLKDKIRGVSDLLQL